MVPYHFELKKDVAKRLDTFWFHRQHSLRVQRQVGLQSFWWWRISRWFLSLMTWASVNLSMWKVMRFGSLMFATFHIWSAPKARIGVIQRITFFTWRVMTWYRRLLPPPVGLMEMNWTGSGFSMHWRAKPPIPYCHGYRLVLNKQFTLFMKVCWWGVGCGGWWLDIFFWFLVICVVILVCDCWKNLKVVLARILV